MEVAVISLDGATAGRMDIPDSLCNRPYNGALVHQASVAAFANGRQGTRAQKTRAQVRHTTAKMFRQKGTGRARGGMSSSPIRRGGGRAFPSLPDENFQLKLPRKMFRAAMAIIFSQLLREERLKVADKLAIDAPKTAKLHKQLAATGFGGRVLMVDCEEDENLFLAVRNLKNVDLLRTSLLRPTDLLSAGTVIFSERAIGECAEKWK